MALYLRLNLFYADGTQNEIRAAIPEDVARAIENKGLGYVTVYVERDIVVSVPENAFLDKFQKRG